MKKNIFKLLVVGTMVTMLANVAVANDNDDYYDGIDEESLYSGPGANMIQADYDGNNGRLYSYGIGPVVIDSYDESKDLSYQSPVTVESTIENPVDNSLIDMGPKSASNINYAIHSIDDGGPGTNVSTNELGTAVLYNNNGPGKNVVAMSYTDDGPKSVESTANPENYLSMIANSGPTSGEGVYRSYKKLSTVDTKG